MDILANNPGPTDSSLECFDGMLIRKATFDRQIVLESKKYLALAPTPDDVVIDVGASIGAATKRFIDCKVSRIIAIEPEITNFGILSINTQCYANRIKLINAGVASIDGPRILWLNRKKNRGMNSLIWSPKRHPTLINCVSFASLLESYNPTLIKSI